ncbi:MAG TPA: DUF3696 domain-containing protein [Azospirillaceae bacterium]|nr:DUF3696 domain-containing protein [Azospirillaceae bacterium]
MLENWKIDNFKSVGQAVSLDLAPITMFVGANSSGKSTIIQSILLMKQTLQYAPNDRPIALNGPLLKLGSFSDVKNALSVTNDFGISFSVVADDQNQFPYILADSLTEGPSLSHFGRSIRKVMCNLRFDIPDSQIADELTLLQPLLLSSTLEVVANKAESSEEISNLSVRRSNRSPETKLRGLDVNDSRALRFVSSLAYDVKNIDQKTRSQVIENRPDGEVVGAVMRHFVPLSIAVKFDVAKQRAREIADVICERQPLWRLSAEVQQFELPESLVDILEKWIEENSNQAYTQQFLFSDRVKKKWTLNEMVEKIRYFQRRRLPHVSNNKHPLPETSSVAGIQNLHPIIEGELLHILERKNSVDFGRAPAILDASVYIREYFSRYVRYLGPLRDEPKPLYPLEALANPTDVGYRGEHTAAVLDLHKHRTISYIPAKSFREKDVRIEPVNTSLLKAVVDWLSYMGVVDAVSTGDKGKFGHELQVRTPGVEKYHDLTNVGVGVSQVLPIVVMALIAPVGSLLIFEQPELHLHPRVQTRLADFFISIAKHGKQCILETHSEYLIYRLRRRVAESHGDDFSKLSKLYFVERLHGETTARPVEINKYGAIIDWPEDFFDQSQDEAERILLAASQKKSQERKAERK